MSTERFSPEFKEEAVMQIVERGYSVAEVSARHSLYKWVKAVSLDKTEKQASELLEAKREVLRKGPRVKYRFINEHRHEHKVATMRRVLGVGRAGFYQWLHQPLSDRAIEDQRLLIKIKEFYVASGGVYGSRRVLLT